MTDIRNNEKMATLNDEQLTEATGGSGADLRIVYGDALDNLKHRSQELAQLGKTHDANILMEMRRIMHDVAVPAENESLFVHNQLNKVAHLAQQIEDTNYRTQIATDIRHLTMIYEK